MCQHVVLPFWPSCSPQCSSQQMCRTPSDDLVRLWGTKRAVNSRANWSLFILTVENSLHSEMESVLTKGVNSCYCAKHHFIAAILFFQIISAGLERKHNPKVLSEWSKRCTLKSSEAETLLLQSWKSFCDPIPWISWKAKIGHLHYHQSITRITCAWVNSHNGCITKASCRDLCDGSHVWCKIILADNNAFIAALLKQHVLG